MLLSGRHRLNAYIMLRKLLAVLICLPLALATYAAQLTATLQSGDNVRAFYGDSALVKAYDAAVDGDIITLSPGIFKTKDIEKSISVIGTYAFIDNASLATIVNSQTIIADGVTLEGLRIRDNLFIKACDNLTINRCFIVSAQDIENGDKKYHNNTIVTDCRIAQFWAMSLSKNAIFRNCCINEFGDCNEAANPALIENCNIPKFSTFRGYNEYAYFGCQPYAIYRDCFIGLYHSGGSNKATLTLKSPSEFHNNIFHKSYYYSNTHSSFTSWNISFGSCINVGTEYDYRYNVTSESVLKGLDMFISFTINGLTVGPIDHKSYPSTPEITSSEIDTETDADGQLHVKINATARD